MSRRAYEEILHIIVSSTKPKMGIRGEEGKIGRAGKLADLLGSALPGRVEYGELVRGSGIADAIRLVHRSDMYALDHGSQATHVIGLLPFLLWLTGPFASSVDD